MKYIISRLDYCNAVYTGLPKCSIVKLQLIQNAAGKVLMKLKKQEHIIPVLMELHCLPVHQRIDYKIITSVYKALLNLTSSYISDCLSRYIPNRMLRSYRFKVAYDHNRV